jgi:NADH-quinone oxidoreductase subunit F
MDLVEKVDLKLVGCPGFCELGPVVMIRPQEIFYQKVRAEQVPQVISRTVLNDEIIDELLYTDPMTSRKVAQVKDVAFYKPQRRIILGENDKIESRNIDDYIALGGYSALCKALNEMTPDEIIDEIKESNLRGRGGGGFPTGRKWESCRNAKGDTRYVICNADEGDPGAFMDRSLLEGNPHSIIEGMLIGAYAIGSNQGYIYVRNEYPLALENAENAIKQAVEYGLLGDDILGSGLSFSIKVIRGGGAFVCGESTALMASLEGKRGEPRPKHIHTVESGLYNKPTNLNNVETWANVPVIISRGAEWYSSIGTESSKGTKIFSLVGNINNTGLVEVPMGTTFYQMIFEIGGGIPDGKELKAVQTGGPSGGCIPSDLIDTPIDFDALRQLGSMMGSGGMIVMDEDACMVDIAKYFVDFLKGESCGKCTPCREGLYQMGEILKDITEGRGNEAQVELLQQLAVVMKDASLCALGQTAANPVLSTIRYFRDEYMAHISEGKCPAGVCLELIEYSIDPEKCTGCRRCVGVCPQDAISGDKNEPHVIEPGKCVKCGSCYDTCKFDAIMKV